MIRTLRRSLCGFMWTLACLSGGSLVTACSEDPDDRGPGLEVTKRTREPFGLIPSRAAQDRFGLHAGDTLSEVDTSQVPQGVRASARAAEQRPNAGPRFDPRCTRFYPTVDSLYVVMLEAGCLTSSDSIPFHSEAFLVVSREGRQRDSLILWPFVERYFEYRFPR